jgi:hypothetical protein
MIKRIGRLGYSWVAAIATFVAPMPRIARRNKDNLRVACMVKFLERRLCF